MHLEACSRAISRRPGQNAQFMQIQLNTKLPTAKYRLPISTPFCHIGSGKTTAKMDEVLYGQKYTTESNKRTFQSQILAKE